MNSQSGKLNYQTAFFVAVAVIAAMALAALFYWRKSQTAPVPAAIEANSNLPAAPMNTPSPEAQLASIQLSPERMQMIGVKLAKTEILNVTDEVRATGSVEINERQVAYVQARVQGWIRQVFADATYQYIRKGQPLFTLYSPDLVATQQEYLLARKNAETMQSSTVGGVTSGSQSLLAAARQRLEQWEVPASEIQKLETTGKVITDLTFNSPVSGYITERLALPNMYVQPETKLYTVADLSTVWVYANVFQADLGKLRPGDQAAVTVDTYPGKIFSGRIAEVLPQLDMNTRTARVRIVMSNANAKLMPGMYVNVTMRIPLGRKLTVPSSAVLHAGSRQLVFVSRGQGNFDPREVQTAEQIGDKAIISKGLKAGETVVTSANFLIDSESQLQAASGAFVPPAPVAGSAPNAKNTAEDAVMELVTQPDPPHKGSNLLRVKLSAKSGTPISGAQISVTFFMPAMPAMGMAAVKTSADLSDKGGGQYEGNVNLSSGGSWQVTIIARQNGRVIGGRHLSVTAEGGM